MNFSPNMEDCKSFISLAVFNPTPGNASASCLALAVLMLTLVSTGKISFFVGVEGLTPSDAS